MQSQGNEEIAGRISEQFVDLMEEMTRHRPENARVFFNENVITIVADNTLTRIEKALAMKDEDAALDHRRRLQKAICSRISDMVEEVTGNRMLGCLADHAVEPDVGVYNLIIDESVDGG